MAKNFSSIYCIECYLHCPPIFLVSATLDEPTPVFQRGGTIIPTLQRVRRSTKIMMNDPYTLIVALDENGAAKGHLYMDDGQSFKVS